MSSVVHVTIPYDVFARKCESRALLDDITGRWSPLLLGTLHKGGTLRFGELHVRVDGISEKVLSQTLRTLERDGLVLREAFPVVPPRVQYSLTELGADIAARIADILAWTQDNASEILAAQKRVDARRRSVG